MATLVEVLAEFFRAFGYTPQVNAELEGTTGRRHAVALLLEKDNRRLAVTVWNHRQSLGTSFLREFTDAVKDTGCDGGLVASLGTTPETLLVEAGQQGITVWDSRRTAQELGNAVLRETCPTVWHQTDPLTAPRPSRIIDHVHRAIIGDATPTATEPTPIPVPIETPLPPPEPAPETLQLPMAFGILDQAMAPEPAPIFAPIFEQPPAPAPSAPPSRNTLRTQVTRALATSLAKAKTRTVERMMLRLVPYHVFDYEASLLVEGSLQSEKRTGRMAVDAAAKRIRDWTWSLDVAELANEGVDVDEKPIRLSEEDAQKMLATELRTLVTRDVVLEEDDSEWSVVVKKKVELAEEELHMVPRGIYYVPIWRASGRDGSIEIDATNGQILHEELTIAKSDAVLI